MADEEGGGQEAAVAFANDLLQLLRLVRLYETDNVAFTDPLRRMQAFIAQGVEKGGSVRIQEDEGMLYYNKEPLRGGRRAFSTIQGLVKGMEASAFAEVAFVGALTEADLRLFCKALKASLGKEDAAHETARQLEAMGLKDRIAIYAPGETTGKAVVKKVDIDEATYFPLAYARTLVLLREFVKNLRNEELNRYFTQKLHRALQEVVGMAGKYFNRWLSLTAVKSADEYLFNHMANTGLLSILLGHQLGLTKAKLSELGFSAMLSCLGLFRTERELVEKSALDQGEQSQLGRHPYRAVGAHLEGRKLTPKVLSAAVTAFHYDLHRGTTPMRLPPAELHPYARIVRICEAYDAMTSPRADRPAMLPDQALKALIEAKAGWYDPLMLTVFTNMMGLFPTGTTVTLSTGEVAVVTHPNPEHPRRPLVAIVRGRDGQPVDGDFLDLATKGEDGKYVSAITGSVDPSELGITIPDYLLA
jgi:HD-GYP domain-containing protein (c-di-GMP phosphodiesterase class II)